MSGSRLRVAAVWALLLGVQAPAAHAALQVVIVAGLGGTPSYAQQFEAQAQALQSASRRLTPAQNIRLLSGVATSRAAVIGAFQQLRRVIRRGDRLIVYLIGHGSFDGRQYRFNLPGPDLSGQDLATLLDALPAPEQLIVATGSCSGALLPVLARPQRVVITATRNGEEKNVTHFGAAFVAALSAAQADTNKDGLISAREAYDYANQQVQQYFRQQTLLASEHAALEGGQSAVFAVTSLVPIAVGSGSEAAGGGAAVPAALAKQRAQLNVRIQALEQRKARLAPDAYASQLEQLLLQLAELQQRIDQQSGRATATAGVHAP